MDTKQLYDWANDAGLNFNNEYDSEYAIEVWTDAIMQDSGYLVDFWLDALADFHDDGNRGQMDGLLKSIGRLSDNTSRLRDRCFVASFAYMNDSALHSSLIGQAIFSCIANNIERMVEKNAGEWWADVCEYKYNLEH